MTRRRLRRRLLWAGVLLGLAALLVVVSALRICVWGRDLLTQNASRLERRALGTQGGEMTRALTFIVGIAMAAVAFAPAALGEGRLAPPSQQSSDTPTTARLLDTDEGHPPPYRASGPHHRATATPPLAASPTYTTRSGKGAPARLAATRARAEPRLFIGYTKPESAAHATPGRGMEWSQIGIGVAIGMALAIGLALGLQAVRARPVAH